MRECFREVWFAVSRTTQLGAYEEAIALSGMMPTARTSSLLVSPDTKINSIAQT